MTKLHKLAEQGQAIWIDYIQRSFIQNGSLHTLIAKGVRGVTSNPSIFEKAIAESNDYDADIGRLTREGASATDIYEALVFEDIRQAADLFRPLYEQTDGLDGYVSLEVSPVLADNSEETIREARRIFAELNRPNILIKIPATPAGILAIEEVIASGVNVNVTLIFSVGQYEAAAKAYLAGLEKMLALNGDISSIASVASLFISRVDTAVDAALQKAGHSDLQGRIAVDNARLAYARFQSITHSDRWTELARAGAKRQRPLWASTGTKNPAYSNTCYVDELIGSDTVNTLPPATLDSYMDHGKTALRIEKDLAGAQDRINSLAIEGVNFDEITQKLLDEGVEAFALAFENLMHSIEEKRNRFRREPHK